MRFSGPIVRPPTHAHNIFIEVTVGCTWDKCTFCNFYDGYPFRMVPLEQIEAAVKESAELYPHQKAVWASGGNPYALATDKLYAIGEIIQQYIPDAYITTYARIDDLFRKSVDDIKRLMSVGFKELVIGIESGDDEVLSHVNKGYSAQDIIDQCQKLDAAGLPYRMIYLGALAGHGKAEITAKRSAAVINQINPHFMYLTTATVLPGTELYTEREKGSFQEMTERERIIETRTLIENLNMPITVFNQSSTNMLSFTVQLPDDKMMVVRELDKVIDSITDDDEEQMKLYRNRLRTV